MREDTNPETGYDSVDVDRNCFDVIRNIHEVDRDGVTADTAYNGYWNGLTA